MTVFPDGAEKYLTEIVLDGRRMTQRVDALGAGVDAAIRRHGEETYPHECCGALVGSGGRVTHAVAAAEHDGRRTAAAVPGAAVGLSAGGAAGGELGGELLGFYHSHPDHPARPSQFDLDHAWPKFAYVIVSVTAGRAARHDRLVSEGRPIQFR